MHATQNVVLAGLLYAIQPSTKKMLLLSSPIYIGSSYPHLLLVFITHYILFNSTTIISFSHTLYNQGYYDLYHNERLLRTLWHTCPLRLR